MKVVINDEYGGFGLSPLATQMFAKLKGKKCFFFKTDFVTDKYIPITLKEAEKEGFWLVYTVPNPQDYMLKERDKDGLFKSANARAEKISLEIGDVDRSDPDLIKVVEKLGKKANGDYASLKIVEIPDGTEYEIEEYDGNEWISESHERWS